MFFLVLAALVGGGVAALQPSPVADPGTAKREGAYFVGPGEIGLHRCVRLKLSDGAPAPAPPPTPKPQ